MKKLFLALITAMMLILPAIAFAAGTVRQNAIYEGKDIRVMQFYCVGDSSDGSIPDTTVTLTDSRGDQFALGYQIVRLIIENEAADTGVTDNSDVYLKDSGGTDLLGGQGVDQLDDDTRNYIRMTNYDPVISPLTLDVDNQSVNSGVYTITIVLAK